MDIARVTAANTRKPGLLPGLEEIAAR